MSEIVGKMVMVGGEWMIVAGTGLQSLQAGKEPNLIVIVTKVERPAYRSLQGHFWITWEALYFPPSAMDFRESDWYLGVANGLLNNDENNLGLY